MKITGVTAVSLLILAIWTCGSRSAKILVLNYFGPRSHFSVMQPLVDELASRGHQVTAIVRGGKFVNETVKYVQLQTDSKVAPPKVDNMFQVKGYSGILSLVFHPWAFIVDQCEEAYKLNLKTLADFSGRQKFDLILTNGWTPCFDALVLRIGAPYIRVITMPLVPILARDIGNPAPWSFVPHVMSGNTHEMTFVERFYNMMMDLADTWFFTGYFQREHNRIAKKYGAKLGLEVPDYMVMNRNASLIFDNSNYAVNNPRPHLPEVVEVGGMQCQEAKAFPEELEKFVSDAEEGVIFFSLGSVVDTNDMPNEIRLKFVNVFKKLKQRVLWKWNSGEMADKPPNVMVRKWLPQQDILGHPKTKVFITHGGLLSTQEAAFHGVPSLGLPFYLDQTANIAAAVKNGYALQMDILEFSEEELLNKLRWLLNDEKIVSKAKEISSIVRDQMQSPLERGVYWAEYVIRHEGAPYIKSAARLLNFWQYHSLDVLVFLAVVLSAVAYLQFISIRFVVQLVVKNSYRKLKRK